MDQSPVDAMKDDIGNISKGINNSQKDFYVVGIGASAGGIQALKTLFENIGPIKNMAFIVILHLSPNYKSLIAEILSKHTNMKVSEAKEGITIEPNNVYIIPPNKILTLEENKLSLSQLNRMDKINLSIDIFFNSLADKFKEKSIGIILSGTGKDGTRGCKAIKESGGLVIVQDEISAKFTSMPHNVIMSELFDYILPPELIGQQLENYVKYPNNIKKIEKIFSKDEIEDNLNKEISIMYDILNNYSGIDFSNYKQSTIIRSISRRMKICQIGNIKDYYYYLYQNPKEVKLLYKSLLISVTKFFRDSEAFKVLEEEIVPQICDNKNPVDDIRIWVPGCATGEEAYSIAILFNKYIERHDLNLNIKIFATDVDRKSLEYASKGIYPESIALDVTEERLKEYFQEREDSYIIQKKIRDMVMFSYHNLINDPPFNKIDLISCRNLFIYIKPELQKKILNFFHFALNPGGFLFLGSGENISGLKELFSVYSNKWKIFKTENVSKSHIVDSNIVPLFQEKLSVSELFKEPVKIKRNNKDRLIREIQSKLIDEYIPPCIIIDNDNKLFHLYGDADKYLNFPKGIVNLDIFNMVPKKLHAILNSAIRKVRRDKINITFKNLSIPDYKENINLVVKLYNISENDDYVAIFFEPVYHFTKEEQKEKISTNVKLQDNNRDLELELQRAKEALLTTLEEVETYNEELQTTNEELLATNEELQTTNEELQSVNEELITVNTQYSKKIEELTNLNNDMSNFLSSTNIGTMFLDNDFTIKRFTPSIQEAINVMDFDIGRPLKHISHNLKGIDLVEDCKKVLDTLIPITKEVKSTNDKWYVLRILPYRTIKNVIMGLTITFVDITELKQATDKLHKLSMAIEQSSSLVIIVDTEGKIEYINEKFVKKKGYSKKDVIGKKVQILKAYIHDDIIYNKIVNIIVEGKEWKGELVSTTKEGELFWVYTTISPVKNKKGDITNYIAILEDITSQREMIKTIKDNEEKFRLLFNEANDAIFLYGFNAKGMPTRIIEVNDTACKILGYSKEELSTMSHFDIVSEKHILDIPKIHEKLLNNGYITYEIGYVTKGGEVIPVEINSHVFMMKNEKVVLSIARDISVRKRNLELQDKLEKEERLLKESLEYDRIKTEFFSNLSHEFRTPLNVIFGAIQVLEINLENIVLNEKSNKVNKQINILRQNCYRLMRLVNNLIDITKIDAGFFQVSLQNCNIVEIVEDITLSVAEYIENKFISLTFDTDVEEKILACDPNQIERVILNLLANSVKFTKPGGKILVRLKEKENSILLIVEDTGIGIPKEKLGIIFERFRQVDKSLTRKHEGSGIGLSIVKSLIDMHEGTINVESEYGKGTKVIIEIPVKTIEEYHEDMLMFADNEENKQRNIERINIEFSDIYS